MQHRYAAVLLSARNKLQALEAICIQRQLYQTGILCFGVKQKVSKAVHHRCILTVTELLQHMRMISDDQIRTYIRNFDRLILLCPIQLIRSFRSPMNINDHIIADLFGVCNYL